MRHSAKLIMGLYLCGLIACSPQATPDDGARASTDGAVLHRGNGGEPDTLEPHRSEERGAAEILRDLFEGLTTETVDSRVVPGTAASWTVSDDGLVYTFSLRADARWSNDGAVVAEDFVAGIRRTADPVPASTDAQILYPIEHAFRPDWRLQRCVDVLGNLRVLARSKFLWIFR